MNSFKKIVSLFAFGMMASPLCSMDFPVGENYPTSFLGIMALRQKDPAYHIAKAERENRIRLQAAEQELFYKEELRTILAENFRKEQEQIRKFKMTQEVVPTEITDQGSPNTIVYSPRSPKSILKTSLNSAFAKPNKK